MRLAQVPKDLISSRWRLHRSRGCNSRVLLYRMRSITPTNDAFPARRDAWRTMATLLPYLWEFKARVILALSFLTAAKLANVGVPLLMKQIVDALDAKTAVLVLPLALRVMSGLLRLSPNFFADCRAMVFGRVPNR